MTSFSLLEVILIALPFVLWFAGIGLRIPIVVFFSGALFCFVAISKFSGWLLIFFLGMGVFLMIGSVMKAKQ